MTKSFDTINREHLHILLSDILDPDELNIMNILLKDVTQQVKNNVSKGQTFTTLGIPQGDCFSAILFTLYLSNTLSAKIPTHQYDYDYYNDHNMFLTPFEHHHDHNCCIKQDKDIVSDYIIDQQYADDIGFISNNKNIKDKAMKNIAPILEERNLTINEKKAIQHTIKRTHKNDWKKCKYLGTLRDTETDIERRKNLTYIAFNKYRQTLTCKNFSLYLRIRLFDIYVTSIFMHSSEHWTLTKSLEKKIDAFHRQLLRQLLSIHYPNNITNNDIYAMTRQHLWTDKINQNKLRLTGHILRLPEGTRARQALQIALKPVTSLRGRQKNHGYNLRTP